MAAHQLSCHIVPAWTVAAARPGRRRSLNHLTRKRQADRLRSGSAAVMGVGDQGKQEAGCTERAKRCGASQHGDGRRPGEAAEGAERQPSQPWCVGTAQLTSEADAASKPVPEGNVWHQGLASAAPGSCGTRGCPESSRSSPTRPLAPAAHKHTVGNDERTMVPRAHPNLMYRGTGCISSRLPSPVAVEGHVPAPSHGLHNATAHSPPVCAAAALV